MTINSQWTYQGLEDAYHKAQNLNYIKDPWGHATDPVGLQAHGQAIHLPHGARQGTQLHRQYLQQAESHHTLHDPTA